MNIFAKFMCNFGEQTYWAWMDAGEHPGKVTFDYHNRDRSKRRDDPTAYGGFVANHTIRTTPYDE